MNVGELPRYAVWTGSSGNTNSGISLCASGRETGCIFVLDEDVAEKAKKSITTINTTPKTPTDVSDKIKLLS